MTRSTFVWTLVWIVSFAAIGGEYVLLSVGSSSDRYRAKQRVFQPPVERADEAKPVKKAADLQSSLGSKPARKAHLDPPINSYQADLKKQKEQTRDVRKADLNAAKRPSSDISAAHAPGSNHLPTPTKPIRRHANHSRDGYIDLTNLSIVCFTRDGRPVCGPSDKP